MMAGILIVAHTPLASAMLEFVEHIYGDVPENIFAVNVPAHEDVKLTLNKLQNLVDGLEGVEEVLVITDIMGATPSNVASRLVNNFNSLKQIQVITGVNLPMLLRAITHRHEPLAQIIEKALQGGQQGIMKIRDSSKVS
jgi:PTS system ascorbate-specific IIA component